MLVIPAIDLRGGQVVRLHQGREDRSFVYGSDPLAVADQWLQLGILRLHVIDLDGAFSGSSAHQTVIRQIAAKCEQAQVPLQVGGGIRERSVVDRLLQDGVSQVILSTILFEQRDFLSGLVQDYPKKVIVSFDIKNEEIHFRGWKKSTGVDWTQALNPDGPHALEGLEACFALVITDISRDGTLSGPNLELLHRALELSPVPVMLAGGLHALDDIALLLKSEPRLYGVITGKAIYEGTLDLQAALALTRDKN